MYGVIPWLLFIVLTQRLSIIFMIAIEKLIVRFGLMEHAEGGYYNETNRNRLLIPNLLKSEANNETRTTITTIYYLLTAGRAFGYFHRNKSRTIHCLHEGRGTYALLYSPRNKHTATAHIEDTTKGRYERKVLKSGWTLEVFDVGNDAGVYQWLVEGDVYKASFLRTVDTQKGSTVSSQNEADAGLFISEVVSPGFEFVDHNFMPLATFQEAFGSDESFRGLVNPKD